MRTDLDSFSELEAHALMTGGYLATRYELRRGIGPFRFKVNSAGELTAPAHEWDFLKVREQIGSAADGEVDPTLAKRQYVYSL